MSAAAEDRSHRALQIVREQLAEATRAEKCHPCGCLQQTVAALDATDTAPELRPELSAARATFTAKQYDCLGCPVCYPAIAANAFSEAFPTAGAKLDLCPTEAPEPRDGWPPLPGNYRALRYSAPVAVCTLNDEALSAELADAAPEALAIVGSLQTENLGIERIILNVLANPNIRRLVLCGSDTQQAVGHLPGQSLASLCANGVDQRGRIRGANGKRPVLKNVTREQIEAFRRQVELVAAIGERDVGRILEIVAGTASGSPGPFDGAPQPVRIERVRASEPARLVQDPAGYFVVYPDRRRALLSVEHFSNAGVLTCVIEGAAATALYGEVVSRGLVSRLDHAAYLGRELARAEQALVSGEPYVQDRAPGEIDESTPPACGCSGPCGG